MLEIIKDPDVLMVVTLVVCVVIGSYLNHRQVNPVKIADAEKESPP